jgi:diguanylate cyclase (GGDEF)-like protein
MARARRSPEHNYAVMFLDFDRFKIINDSLGHNVGDALLIGIAKRLREHVRDVDSVSASLAGHTSARLGGDEFVVLLDDIHTPAGAAAVADRLLQALAQPYRLDKHEVYSTASIGIVMGDPAYEHAEEVVRDADTAMYESKRLGRGRYTLFDASMRERVQRHLRLESELRKAIGTPQLWLTYQPIVSLSTGAFMGVEALLRWRHPTEGQIDPSEFVAIAEESDLILTLGEWALREACRQFVCWQEQLGMLAPRKVSINVSRRQFATPNLPQIIAHAMRESGIEPSQVQLELTEDAFVSDVSEAVETMRAIKRLGIELAIDDFGTGTSSFASLHEFPVDVLKIHRSMLIGIEDSKDVASLIHGLAVMVKNMGIDMVAEGVETPAQVIALQELGCDFAQGFFFARPLSAAEVPEFASRNLSMTCSTRGAAAYANQWNERLTVFHEMQPADDSL